MTNPDPPPNKLPKHAMLGTLGKVRVLEYHGNNYFTVLDRTDTRRYVHRDRLIFTKK